MIELFFNQNYHNNNDNTITAKLLIVIIELPVFVSFFEQTPSSFGPS